MTSSTWEDKRDQIVARIKESTAYRRAARSIADEERDGSGGEDYYDHEEFIDNVDELAEARDGDEWDDTMYSVYNYFDDQRIWFDIFDKNPPVPGKLYLIPKEDQS